MKTGIRKNINFDEVLNLHNENNAAFTCVGSNLVFILALCVLTFHDCILKTKSSRRPLSKLIFTQQFLATLFGAVDQKFSTMLYFVTKFGYFTSGVHILHIRTCWNAEPHRDIQFVVPFLYRARDTNLTVFIVSKLGISGIEMYSMSGCSIS